jgi:hypothetical protein
MIIGGRCDCACAKAVNLDQSASTAKFGNGKWLSRICPTRSWPCWRRVIMRSSLAGPCRSAWIYLVDIASFQTRDELLQRLDLGAVLVRRVEKWPGFHMDAVCGVQMKRSTWWCVGWNSASGASGGPVPVHGDAD